VAEAIQILYIQADAVGADIWAASHNAFEEAVRKAYRGAKRIEWIELAAGEKALATEGSNLSHARGLAGK
jgi:isocitrate dehydrogenase